ncbi:hypothetical protein CH373_16795 [Leptospira perolatii]|uniref:Lipoprotein n=1 Tax=Leptospira perolatii TaxID=2023191 RepID=A0A2M9ZIW3_9LEPT|nr:hypothetical protein [Leptospira perolatii]PJZ68652.1 hypothetical protein CH360_15340 [Leptospira perolatii]PJZ71999.1 hypothetical protein CH373_16795 [Leptospira perolatii]
MKSIYALPVLMMGVFFLSLGCTNYGLGDNNGDNKDKCKAASVAYLSCVNANPPPSSACDTAYLGALAVCGGGGGGSGGGGGGGGY